MRKYIHLLSLLIMFVGLSMPAKAVNTVGSDWYYTCVPNTNGLFNIRLILYRDCNGTGESGTGLGCVSATINVQMRGADPSCQGTLLGTLTLTMRNVRDINPNPLCPDAKSNCTNCGLVPVGPFIPGVERYEFGIDSVNLGLFAPTCCNILFSYQQCCRSSIITTGGANTNYYTEMTLNRCLSSNPCNSSPVLANDPFAVVCSGQPFMFNNGAIDHDLDSLAYAFVPSLTGSGASVTYNFPYAFNRPMPWTGPANGSFPSGIIIGELTGDIGFTASANNFVGIMAIQIQQWRWNQTLQSYQLVGTTRRDLQAWIKTCAPNNPVLLQTRPGVMGIPNTLNTQWQACPGRTLCFDVVARDADTSSVVSDTTYLSWNASLAPYGATFTPNYNFSQRNVSGPREDDYKFCWTPSQNMISSLPYFFTVRATDSRCPTPSSYTRTFSVLVSNRVSRVSISPIACNSYTSPSGKVFTTAGMYIDTLASFNGCDSIITINLTLNSSSTSTISRIACNRFIAPSGKTFLTSGIYQDTIPNQVNCDSIITINLTINNNTFSTIDTITCKRIFAPSGKLLSSSGTYTDTISNSLGCDSVITINLTINFGPIGVISPVTCKRFTTPSGKILTSSGTYYDTIPAISGCDSILMINLTINFGPVTTISPVACNQFISPSGKIFNTSGSYADTILTVGGCDSIIIINLTINSITDNSISISGNTLVANNTNATYQWLDCNNLFVPIAGATNQSFTPTVNGSYAVRLKQNGCSDTSNCEAIVLIGILENTFNTKFILYPNPTIGQISIACEEPLYNLQLTVRNALGKVILQRAYSTTNQIQFSLEGEAGIYLIELEAGNKKPVMKVIKE